MATIGKPVSEDKREVHVADTLDQVRMASANTGAVFAQKQSSKIRPRKQDIESPSVQAEIIPANSVELVREEEEKEKRNGTAFSSELSQEPLLPPVGKVGTGVPRALLQEITTLDGIFRAPNTNIIGLREGSISPGKVASGELFQYTPIWSTNSGLVSVGNGAIIFQACRLPSAVYIVFFIRFGSTTTEPPGSFGWAFNAPILPVIFPAPLGVSCPVGHGMMYINGNLGNPRAQFLVTINSSGTITFISTQGYICFTTGIPTGFAVNDVLRGSIYYPIRE